MARFKIGDRVKILPVVSTPFIGLEGAVHEIHAHDRHITILDRYIVWEYAARAGKSGAYAGTLTKWRGSTRTLEWNRTLSEPGNRRYGADPRTVDPNWRYAPRNDNLAQIVNDAVEVNTLEKVPQQLSPPHDEYVVLKEILHKYVASAGLQLKRLFLAPHLGAAMAR